MECIFLCPDACFDVFKVALLGFKLGLGVASALFGPSACQGLILFEGQGNPLCLLLDSPFKGLKPFGGSWGLLGASCPG